MKNEVRNKIWSTNTNAKTSTNTLQKQNNHFELFSCISSPIEINIKHLLTDYSQGSECSNKKLVASDETVADRGTQRCKGKRWRAYRPSRCFWWSRSQFLGAVWRRSRWEDPCSWAAIRRTNNPPSLRNGSDWNWPSPWSLVSETWGVRSAAPSTCPPGFCRWPLETNTPHRGEPRCPWAINSIKMM